MRIKHKTFLLGLSLTLSGFINIQAQDYKAETENQSQDIESQEFDQAMSLISLLPTLSPNVIPPGTPLNKYKLLLQVGQDEELANPPATVFTTSGFTDILGWNSTKIDTFRQAAMDWFTLRFGVDFTGSTYDPSTGAVFTATGALIPLRYQGNYRVLQSNKLDIPPYTILTPSTVGLAQYIFVFFSTPIYTGTYANGGPAITGNPTDVLAYSCYRIFLNYQGTNHRTFFGRSYYPGRTEPQTPLPGRSFESLQLYSPDYGPGFSTIRSAAGSAPDNATHALGSWSFPGSHLPELADWNGYTSAPVAP